MTGSRSAILALALRMGFGASVYGTGYLTAQETGTVRGTVTLAGERAPVHHADVMIPRLGKKTETDGDGRFELTGVPAGTWEIIAHMHSFLDTRSSVDVRAGGTVEVALKLALSPVREQVTVTASGHEQSTLESFLGVVSRSSLDLAAKSGSTSLGDLLDDQPGVHKRSFGPGTTRPVVRGFDGDRVLVLEDGVRTGTLSAQSGDHGEPADAGVVERIEVVRGPATLLYGSNAIGGVINAITTEQEIHDKPHEGISGSFTGTGGSNNAQGGASGNVRVGIGNWLLWAGGGGNRMGDYSSPLGEVANSHSHMTSTRMGMGRSSKGASFRMAYNLQNGRYGIPAAPGPSEDSGVANEGHEHGPVDLSFRRHQARFTGSIRDLGSYFEQLTLKLSYTDWAHQELEGDEVGTRFGNKQFVYRSELQQKRRGRLSGSFGIWGLSRDFKSEGEEALSPPVDQTAFAAFALEEVDFERVRLQFGARLERNSYSGARIEARSFTGLSASAGANFRVWKGGAFVANYTHSYRAPSLEDLYFVGPHPGTGFFEVGNAAAKGERGDGVDLSIRHQNGRVRGEANFFAYRLSDFIYLAPTGKIEDGLPEAGIAQDSARYIGGEAKLDVAVRENIWLNFGFDAVRAQITKNGQPLPRIPPVRGRVGVDYRRGGLSLRPELAIASKQDRLFPTEAHTAGYAVPNLTASYTIARQHVLHVFTLNAFNLSNRLYRNHLSLIKEFAPEIGRGIRFSYSMHFY